MRSTFASGGVGVVGPGWSLQLGLEAWGREDALVPVEDAVLQVDGRLVENRRNALTEWYVNEERGLEQGFTIKSAPAGEGRLSLAMSMRVREGELSLEILAGGRAARFVGRSGEVAVHYAGLRAWDATGRELAASLSSDRGRLSILVDDREAAYPVVVDPWIATELAKLVAGDASMRGQLGFSVALSGDRAMIGAPRDDNAGGTNAGAAYVFDRNQGGIGFWGEVVKLTASDGAPSDGFGASVSMSGD